MKKKESSASLWMNGNPAGSDLLGEIEGGKKRAHHI